ncbi:MAG: phosphodiester glycosidase family protein [Chloroflexi bacterium]|nr:phosphodiester glycosidase family protein [Chloroflexota bacterium]
MPARRTLKGLLLLCLLVGSLLACNVLPSVSYNGTPITTPSTPATTAGQSTPTLNVWSRLAPGVELRYEDWKSPGNNEDTVIITRFDLHRVHLSIGYQPNQPLQMSTWMKQTGALALINGGYFDTQNQATSLVIANGHTSGTSYNGFGGMFSVDEQGHVELRSLHEQPYDPSTEQLQYATQSAPMLIVNGKRTQFNANAASQRRSIIAMDKQGRLLFIVSPGQAFSLDETADLLSSSDLSLETALNLDGGASTGLYVHAGGQQVAIDPITPIPIVIIVK